MFTRDITDRYGHRKVKNKRMGRVRLNTNKKKKNPYVLI